jgi:hypothetical protein
LETAGFGPPFSFLLGLYRSADALERGDWLG